MPASSTTAGPDDFPAAAYGPDGTLWVAYICYRLKDENRRIEQQPFREQPTHFKALYTPEFGDQLFVQYQHQGRWSEPIALTGPNEDLVRCGIAVAGDGTARVGYSAHRNGQHDLYVRPVGHRSRLEGRAHPAPRPGPEQRLTRTPGPHLSPVLCTGQDGRVFLSCQSWRGQAFGTRTFTCLEDHWQEVRAADGMPGPGRNSWSPALAAGPGKDMADVLLRVLESGAGASPVVEQPVTASPKFEARPALCYDGKGRLWVAYEEGPPGWGKDYGALASEGGNPLYNSRAVRVVCLEGGHLLQPAASLPTSDSPPPRMPFGAQAGPRYERARRYSNPRLGLDGKGRLWLTYREKFGTRYSTHPGSYWLTFARRLDGDRWTDPIEVHHSDGLLDSRPVLLPHAGGGLVVVHNTDGRYTTPDRLQNRIYSASSTCPATRSSPGWCPTSRAGKTPGKRRRSRKRSAASGSTGSRPPARTTSCCRANSTATPRSPSMAGRTAPWRTCSATPSTRRPWTGSATATTTTAPAGSTRGGSSRS